MGNNDLHRMIYLVLQLIFLNNRSPCPWLQVDPKMLIFLTDGSESILIYYWYRMILIITIPKKLLLKNRYHCPFVIRFRQGRVSINLWFYYVLEQRRWWVFWWRHWVLERHYHFSIIRYRLCNPIIDYRPDSFLLSCIWNLKFI
jgi:hypothetical protein